MNFPASISQRGESLCFSRALLLWAWLPWVTSDTIYPAPADPNDGCSGPSSVPVGNPGCACVLPCSQGWTEFPKPSLNLVILSISLQGTSATAQTSVLHSTFPCASSSLNPGWNLEHHLWIPLPCEASYPRDKTHAEKPCLQW